MPLINFLPSKGWSLFIFFTLLLAACSSKPDDNQIRTEVSNKLKTMPSAEKTEVAVSSGMVTLSGTCMGDSCSAVIDREIGKLDGVAGVTNNLKEEGTDLSLRTSVQTVLSKYPGIQADVNAGVVVLRGTISKNEVPGLISQLEKLGPQKIDNQLAVN